jgi:predicted metal-dependent hydrolase
MTAKVVQFNQIGPVSFQRNRRSKNIKIRVKPDQSVHVSFPWYALSAEVVNFVNKNISWIILQQQKMAAKKPEPLAESIIKTRLHTIEIKKGEKLDASAKNGLIEIWVDDFETEKSKLFVQKIIEDVYRFEARKLLPGRLSELAARHGFQYGKVGIRNNRRNWGSCSGRNNISLNLQMMKLPDELIDYILLHELVHTKIKNHGPLFWEKLDEITGEKARELAKRVRSYSTFTL